jgi:hypothetical protein
MGISRRPNGSLVLTVHITLRPERDDDLIALISQAPKGALAGVVREAMRSGVSNGSTGYEEDSAEQPLSMADLGTEL